MATKAETGLNFRIFQLGEGRSKNSCQKVIITLQDCYYGHFAHFHYSLLAYQGWRKSFLTPP